MKIHILSDLHIDVASFQCEHVDADLVVIAGDVRDGKLGVRWVKVNFEQPVLYVPGNHEYHDPGKTMAKINQEMLDEAKDSHVHVLNRDSFEWNGVRFLGTTLWTDLLNKPFGGIECGVIDVDKRHILSDEGKPFPDAVAQALFEENKQWLQSELNKSYAGKTVVITHHAPSGKSQHPQFEGSPYASCFISDVEELMGNGVDIWIHGHTHNNFDYYVKGTRVVCNPRGYPRPLGGFENPAFNPSLVINL